MSTPLVFEGYSANTNEIVETPATYRGLEQYALMLGFPDKQIFLKSLPKGCRLLDIGSGKEGLKAELAVERSDIQVFSINPSLVKPESRHDYEIKDAVIAINPELPIEDEVFDVVIDQMSSIYYSQGSDEQATQNNLYEIIRVLKKGGVAYVGPTFIRPDKDFMGKGRVGNILDRTRHIKWEKKEFKATKSERIWRSYRINKS